MSFYKPFRHDLDPQEFSVKAVGSAGRENIGFEWQIIERNNFEKDPPGCNDITRAACSETTESEKICKHPCVQVYKWVGWESRGRTFPAWGQYSSSWWGNHFLVHHFQAPISFQAGMASKLGWKGKYLNPRGSSGGSCRVLFGLFSQSYFQIVPEQALNSQSITAQYLWIRVNRKPVIHYLNFSLAYVNTLLVDKTKL